MRVRVCDIYQMRKCNVDPSVYPHASGQLSRSEIAVQCEGQLWFCVYAGSNMQRQHKQVSRTHKQVTHATFGNPTFQHKVEPSPPFPHALHPNLLRLPNTSLIKRSIYTFNHIVKHKWEVTLCLIVMGCGVYRMRSPIKCIAALPHWCSSNWNDSLG